MRFKFTFVKTHKKGLYNLAIILITLLIAFLFYILNYYTPLFADDYSYSFSFSTGEKITSISQILDSQIAHYQVMNGRSVTHFLAQLFLLGGDNLFNFINTIFFLVLIYITYFHACGSFKNFSLSKFSMIAMLLFLSSPAFGQSFLWITGSANYLYGILIVLCFLIPYRLQANNLLSRQPLLLEIFVAIIYMLFGIIAGWTNENTSVAMIVMIIIYIFFFYINSVKIRLWNITGCIGGIIGSIFMISAPGTTNRLATSGGMGGISDLIKRTIFYTCDLFIYLKFIVVLFIIFLTLYLYQNQHILKRLSKENIMIVFKETGITLVYLIGFLASVYSMIVSPQFPERAWSGPIILALISLINFFDTINKSNKKIKVGKFISLLFILLLCISTYINVFFELKNINVSYTERISIIETAISSGKDVVEIPSIYGVSGYSCYGIHGDLNDDSKQWPNKDIAKYYGIQEIVSNN